jgi:hypothetical protein
MGQDAVHLQVLATSGEKHEQKHARTVLKLIAKGKHWVLVTLLLGNVVVNESLPIVLDKALGGGWAAVLGSTVLIGKPDAFSPIPYTNLSSHLRRSHPPVRLRPLRPPDRRLPLPSRPLSHVRLRPRRLADCKAPRLAPR